jgi:Protein of unknown function DUF262.
MSLDTEIKQTSLAVKTSSYAMSIGELANLYNSREIDLHPQFQRFFRWTGAQKTRLIESILLGIPVPPIFVAQRQDGVWDVVDGLQRLSSILEFMGELRAADDVRLPALVLEEAKYLPSLKDKKWDDVTDTENSFNQAQRLFLKRAKLDVNIVLKESDENAKYELFQRLNTGGSQLSDQEVRNCLLIMLRPQLFEWMHEMGELPSFKDSVALSDRAIEEQFGIELVLRFLIFRRIPEERLVGLGDLGDFLTNEMMLICQDSESQLARRLQREAAAFRGVFELIDEQLPADAFRRYQRESQRFLGGFLISAFETVALGLGFHAETAFSAALRRGFKEKVKGIWSNSHFLSSQGSGVRASTRLPRVIPIGREVFGR